MVGLIQKAVMVGMFPPPTSGAAKNNKILFDDLTSDGVDVRMFATSGDGLAHKRGLRYHLDRVRRNISVLSGLLSVKKRSGSFYIVPDAGLGMMYSLLHVLVSIDRFDKIFIHHRSFKYIDTKSPFMGVIVRATRDKATHVFLSEVMGKKFESRYGAVKKVTVSNAHYVLPNIVHSNDRSQDDQISIGHLSNLCRDKGFYEVIAVFEALAPQHENVVLHLAGPAIDSDVLEHIKRLQKAWPNRVSHLGAVYGEEKNRFYEGLDVFLFPTRHPQEAQPNVIYESLAAGVPVLATPRGTIPEMLHDGLGEVSPSEESFVEWCAASLLEVATRRDAKQIVSALREEGEQALEAYRALRVSIAGS